MERSQVIFLTVLLVIVLFSGWVVFKILNAPADEIMSARQSNFNDFSTTSARFTTLTGETLIPEFVPQALLLVVSWASWSPYTPEEFSALNTLRKQYSTDELQIIAINRKETPAKVDRYLAVNPAPAGIDVILDTNDTYYHNSDGFTMPESILYAADGSVLVHNHTTLNLNTIIPLIDSEIAKRGE